MSAASDVKAGRAYVEITLDSSQLTAGLKRAQASLKKFGTSMTNVGKNILAYSAVAAAPLALSVKTFADFDDEMRMAAAVCGATTQELESMTGVAEKLGRETSFTAKQVAEGMTAMGRMGFKPKEIEAAIASVLDLSRATGTDLASAAEIAANNMRVFGMNSSQMTQVADILTATANGSAQTLTDLAEGLKMAGPQAAAAKDNIINVSGALGVLANMGIKGSLAGTALRKAYSQFANTKIQAKLKAIGISTTDANGNLRAMPEIMADIAKHMNTLPSAARLNFAEEIFDLRGSLAGLQLGGNIQQLNAFIAKLKNVGGTANATAKSMDAGIGGALRIFMSAVEGCQIAIGRIIGSALIPYINKISTVLNKVAEWIKAHKELVITITKILLVAIAFGAALVALGLAIKVVAFALGGLNVLFVILKSVIMAPVVAVKALIAVLGLLKTAFLALKAVALATWAVVASPAYVLGTALAAIVVVVWKITGAFDMLKNAIGGMAGDFSKAMSEIGRIFGVTWSVILDAVSGGDLATAAKVGLAALKLAWLSGIYPLKKAWLDFKLFLNDSWTITIYSLLRLGNNLWYGLLIGLKDIGGAMQSAWSVIWNGVLNAFDKTILEIMKAWVKLKGKITGKSEAEIQMQVQELDSNYAKKKQEREKQQQDDEKRRSNERANLEAEKAKKNKDLTQAEAQDIQGNRNKRDDDLKKSQEDIRKATKEWKDAVAEAKRKSEERKKQARTWSETQTEAAASRTEAVNIKNDALGKAAGSFYASEVQSLGYMSAAERTANNTLGIYQNSKQTLQLIKSKKSLVFT